MPTLTSHIKTARRSDSEYNVSLAKRRYWYTDPPTGDTPPAPPTPPVVPPVPPPTPEAKFTQAEMDAIQGRTRKEAADTTTKKMLEQFGVDPNDPKAIDTVKALIAAAKKAEDDKKSAETLALEKVAAAEKERDEMKAAKEALELKSRIKDRDDDVKTALTAARCTNPSKVMALISVMQADELKATLKEDGTVDKGAVTKLVDAAKKEHKEYFVGGGPGIPPTAPGGHATNDTKAAQDANLRQARRDV